MSPDVIRQLFHDGLILAILMSVPLVGSAALVGLLFGFVQALTQLQDQATTFAIKLIVVLGLLFVLSPWLASRIMAYGERVFALIVDVR